MVNFFLMCLGLLFLTGITVITLLGTAKVTSFSKEELEDSASIFRTPPTISVIILIYVFGVITAGMFFLNFFMKKEEGSFERGKLD